VVAFTKAAEEINSENLLVIGDKGLADMPAAVPPAFPTSPMTALAGRAAPGGQGRRRRLRQCRGAVAKPPGRLAAPEELATFDAASGASTSAAAGHGRQ
jgi:hypothetical protein